MRRETTFSHSTWSLGYISQFIEMRRKKKNQKSLNFHFLMSCSGGMKIVKIRNSKNKSFTGRIYMWIFFSSSSSAPEIPCGAISCFIVKTSRVLLLITFAEIGWELHADLSRGSSLCKFLIMFDISDFRTIESMKVTNFLRTLFLNDPQAD